MDIKSTKLYKLYLQYNAKLNRLEKQYLNKEMSKEEYNRLSKKEDDDFWFGALKSIPKEEKKINIFDLVDVYLKEREALKNE